MELVPGKRYRVKVTHEEFTFEDVDGICMDRHGNNTIKIWRIANALATDNVEEVYKKVKRTFYQAVCKRESYEDLKPILKTTCWYINAADASRQMFAGGFEEEDFQVIERQFEVEE